MIIVIQFQHIYLMRGNIDNDPNKTKTYVFTDSEMLEKVLGKDDQNWDFGYRRTCYLWFENSSSTVKNEIERLRPEPISKDATCFIELINKIELKILSDIQVSEEILMNAINESKNLEKYYNNWLADLRKEGFSGVKNIAPFPFPIYTTIRDIISLAERGVNETRENTKIGIRRNDVIRLLGILKELRSGTSKKDISNKFHFNEELWTIKGVKRGLGKALPNIDALAALPPDKDRDWDQCVELLGLTGKIERDQKKN